MNILAVDTATEAFSVALRIDEETRQEFAVAPREHASRLLPAIHRLLAEAELALTDLDALAVTRGPGSFTGVRIGIAAVQGLALGSGLPVAPVSTLRTLARGCARRSGAQLVLALLDARMDQVYVGGYRFGPENPVCGHEIGAEQVLSPDELSVSAGGWTLTGAGVTAYDDRIVTALGEAVGGVEKNAFPEALDVAQLAAAGAPRVAPDAIEPAYLRPAVQGR